MCFLNPDIPVCIDSQNPRVIDYKLPIRGGVIWEMLMIIVRSVVTLAIILATTSSYGQMAFADDNTNTNVATQPETSVASVSTPVATSNSNSTVAVTVQAGDTLSLIATTHNTTVADIVSNNAISDPNVIEPGLVLQVSSSPQALAGFSDSLKVAAAAFMAPPAPLPTAQAPVVASTYTAPQQVRHASSDGNTYTWGTCTWYVKQQIPSLPNQLGNAGYSWLSRAAAYGYATGTAPAPGAIGVESGHVVIVSSVNSNGTVNISEMNYGGGVGVVHTRTTSASTFRYIYV